MLAAGTAFIIALILTPIFRDIFRAYNVVDRPGRRKVHAYPIPRVGGIPIMAGYVFAVLQLPHPGTSHAFALLPGVLAIFAVGLVDDFFNLRPLTKLAGQVGAALLIYANDIRIEKLGDLALPVWLSLPLTVFWLLLATNALNLIDGLDGLCAGMGFFAALAMGAAGVLQHNPALTHVALPLAGALLGFLVYNLNPATVFLGDSGALSTGFLLGCFGLVWTQQSTTLASTAVPLLAMAIPLLDVLISIVRRFFRGHPLFGADRGHTHHRLLDKGCSVRQATGILYLVALAGTGFAVLLAWQPVAGGYHGAVLGGFGVFCLFGIGELRYPELEATKALLFGEFRKAVAVTARLKQVQETLTHAPDLQHWWEAVVRSAKDEGFAGVRWATGSYDLASDVGGRQLQHQLSSADDAWTFEIRLEGGGIVEFSGSSARDAAGASPDLIRFAAVLRESFDLVRARAAQTAIQ
ncbi:MAG: glycosyl transferase, family 4 [Bryobacterales bacterium]|nr:glycosyl transferase, family 4 [Bryobacterales bacterium]